MNISREKFEELCVGYIQYVYNEMQTKGWMQRRSALFAEEGFNEDQYEDEDDECEEEYVGTFQDIMVTKYDGDMDKTLQYLFCEGRWWSPSRRQWFTCYVLNNCAEVKETMNHMRKYEFIWRFNDEFTRWMLEDDSYQHSPEKMARATEKFKSILGLDVCLK